MAGFASLSAADRDRIIGALNLADDPPPNAPLLPGLPVLPLGGADAPSVPTDVAARAAGGGPSELIAWVPSIGAAGGAGIRSYRIYRDAVLVAEVPYPASTYLDVGLAVRTRYLYQVSAVASAGIESAKSVAATGVTAAFDGPAAYALDCSGCHGPLRSSAKIGRTAAQIAAAIQAEPPMQPLGNLPSTTLGVIAAALLATPDRTAPAAPGGLIVTIDGAPVAHVTWQQTVASGGAAIVAYRMFRDGELIGETPELAYTDPTANRGSTYAYAVSALDFAGNESVRSVAYVVTVPGTSDLTPPSSPHALIATAASATEVDLGWDAATSASSVSVIAANAVYSNGTRATTVLAPATFAAVTGLTPATTYTFTVVAIDSIGTQSAPSTPQTLTTPSVAVDYYSQVAPSATRSALASRFLGVFGAVSTPPSSGDSQIAAVVNAAVASQAGGLGGPCRRYDDSCPGGAAASFVTTTAAMLPLPNAIRYGYLGRACEEVLSIGGAVTNALTRAGIGLDAPPTSASIQLAFALFYPGRQADAAAEAALLNVSTAARSSGLSSLDAWSFTFVPMCKSVLFESY